MTDEMINAVLTGRDNSLNRSILVILQEQEHIRSQLWQVDTTEEKLQNEVAGSIDVLLVDLQSFSKI